MEPYRTLFPDAHRHLPYTEQIAERVLVLPTGAMIREPEIDTICDILRTANANANIIRNRILA
jgi:dTDP-4-amino-4,6-dideoxygalactose transaminase